MFQTRKVSVWLTFKRLNLIVGKAGLTQGPFAKHPSRTAQWRKDKLHFLAILFSQLMVDRDRFGIFQIGSVNIFAHDGFQTTVEHCLFICQLDVENIINLADVAGH